VSHGGPHQQSHESGNLDGGKGGNEFNQRTDDGSRGGGDRVTDWRL
jgi:hypothetical protein